MRPIAALIALLLAGCATQPIYAPAAGPGRPGYSEQRIEADRYRVVYRAQGPADPGVLETFALRRAAQVTIDSGYDWFMVDQRRLERAGYDRGPRASVGVGSGSFGRRSSFGVGVGVGFPLGGSRDGANAAVLDIRLGRGAKPDSPSAYSAREVLRSLLSSAPPR